MSKEPKMIEGVECQRQRLILDCRQVNLQFRAPPLTELGSLASFVKLNLGRMSAATPGGADIQDCFYAGRMPLGLTEFFCLLQDVSVSDLYDITGGDCPEFLRLGGRSKLSPCLKVRPMGFSSSFYLVQQIHEQIMNDSWRIPSSRLFLDARPVPQLRQGECAGMPYGDNVHVLTTNVNTAEKHCVGVCNELASPFMRSNLQQLWCKHWEVL